MTLFYAVFTLLSFWGLAAVAGGALGLVAVIIVFAQAIWSPEAREARRLLRGR